MIYKMKDIIIPHFHEVWRVEKVRKIHNLVKKGGRNTGKTTQTAIRIVYNRMRTNTSALVIRKYYNTLRQSAFQDLVEAIGILGVNDKWEYTRGKTGALYMVYKPTGTEILFKGGDSPDPVKGIKSKWPISDCWFEELAEYRSPADLNVIKYSVMRDERTEYFFHYTYNPPKKKTHWTNKRFGSKILVPRDTYIHHSTIYDNPYASKQAIQEAENMKEENYLEYCWTFLGDAIGGGLVPFKKLTFRPIEDKEISIFDNLRVGLDWGYAKDPLAVVLLHLDIMRKKIYIFGEISGLQMGNEELIEKIMSGPMRNLLITCDSASPKDIMELRNAGLDAIGATKGPGSVEYGEKWLNKFEIIVDPDRAPVAARQFEDIDYAVDRNGNTLSRLIDFDNDFIDATRYACEGDMYGATIY